MHLVFSFSKKEDYVVFPIFIELFALLYTVIDSTVMV